MASYTVKIKTGDVANAGTDARVKIQLQGARVSPEIPLKDSGGKKFERNQVDTFQVSTDDVGWIDRVRLYHDNANDKPGWYVDYVEVINNDLGLKWTVPFRRWLAKNEGDGRIDVTRDIKVGVKVAEPREMCARYLGFLRLGTYQHSGPTWHPYQVRTPLQYMRKTWVLDRGTQVITTQRPVPPLFFNHPSSLDHAAHLALYGSPPRMEDTTVDCVFHCPPGPAWTVLGLMFSLGDETTGLGGGLIFGLRSTFWQVVTPVAVVSDLSPAQATQVVDELLARLTGPSGTDEPILREKRSGITGLGYTAVALWKRWKTMISPVLPNDYIEGGDWKITADL